MVVVFTALTIYELLAGSFSPAWVSKQMQTSVSTDPTPEEELVEETRALQAKSRVFFFFV
jgi:hypothetical protein